MLYDHSFWLLHLICIDARSSNKQTVARKMRPLWLRASLAVLFTDLMLQIRLIHLISSNRRRDIKCFLTFDWYQTVTGWRYAASTGTIRPSMWSLTVILAYNIVRDTLQRLRACLFCWQAPLSFQGKVCTCLSIPFSFSRKSNWVSLNWNKSLSRMLKVGYDDYMQNI